MTKTVRVENADTSSHKVVVRTYDRIGEQPDPKVDTLVSEVSLDFPTAMLSPGIHSSRYLVIVEA